MDKCKVFIHKKGLSHWEIDKGLLNRYLYDISDQDVKRIYSSLIIDNKIVGGIGTLYVKEKLFDKLGYPEIETTSPLSYSAEQLTSDVLFVNGINGFELIVGMPNLGSRDKYEVIFYFLPSSSNPGKGTFIKETIPLE